MAKLAPPVMEFLGSVGFEEAAPPSTRALATILFTDIVGSTQRAAERGDRAWRELLEKHDAVAAEAVAESGGRLVKTTGDGLLATFDGPSAGITAARAIRDKVTAFDVLIRGGVHTGEVERRGRDVGGIGVHIGARVLLRLNPGCVGAAFTRALTRRGCRPKCGRHATTHSGRGARRGTRGFSGRRLCVTRPTAQTPSHPRFHTVSVAGRAFMGSRTGPVS